MALLGLFLLVLVAAAIMLLAPVKRYREELPREPLSLRLLAQLAPLAIATIALLVFREDVNNQLTPELQPAVEPVMLAAFLAQLATTFVVLGRTSLSGAAKSVYAVVSALGVLGAILLVAWFSR